MIDADLFQDDDLPGWYAQAACRGADTSLFFIDKGASARQALEICEGCPVRTRCLEYALAEGIGEGIWGGMGPDKRKRLLRERQAA